MRRYFKIGTVVSPSAPPPAALKEAQPIAAAESSATGTPRPPHVLAVTGGKGGVGKSSIAVNLAIALARAGGRVCVLDADTGLANVNILLGLKPRFTLEHLIFGARPIEEVMVEGPFGLKIVPGANGISACASLLPRQQIRLTRELARIESEFEYLILDSAAGIADSTLDLVGSAHQALVVITPDPTSLTDAFSLVKLLQRRRPMTYQVVVNLCDTEWQGQDAYRRFSAAVKTYIGAEPKLLDIVLRSDAIREAVKRQTPVASLGESDPACRHFIRLAAKLQRELDAEPPALGFAEFWHHQYEQRRPQPAPHEAEASQEPRGKPTEEEVQRLYEILLNDADASPESLARLIHKLHEAFRARFERLAMEPTALVAGAFKQKQSHAQPVEEPAAALGAGHPVAPSSNGKQVSLTRPASNSAACGAAGPRFDANRFGSQQALLELLRAQAEPAVPTRELIASLERLSNPA